jgi:hypothetical protein
MEPKKTDKSSEMLRYVYGKLHDMLGQTSTAEFDTAIKNAVVREWQVVGRTSNARFVHPANRSPLVRIVAAATVVAGGAAAVPQHSWKLGQPNIEVTVPPTPRVLERKENWQPMEDRLLVDAARQYRRGNGVAWAKFARDPNSGFLKRLRSGEVVLARSTKAMKYRYHIINQRGKETLLEAANAFSQNEVFEAKRAHYNGTNYDGTVDESETESEEGDDELEEDDL